MKTKDLKTLLETFSNNGISHEGNRLKEVLQFQDIIGRSNFNEIFEMYSEMDKPQKGVFLWAACTCLDKDTFLEIVKKVVCESIIYENEMAVEARYQEKFNAINKREKDKDIIDRILKDNGETIKSLIDQRDKAESDNRMLREKAQSFDTIKRLLK